MPIDPRHQRDIPSGLKIASALRAIFRRQGQEIRAHLNLVGHGPKAPDLSHWTPTMVEVLTPLMLAYYRDGGQDAALRIARALGVSRKTVRAGYAPVRRGVALLLTVKEDPAPEIGFDVFSPKVTEAVQQLVLQFCQSTNQTSTMDLQAALDETRRQLAAGLSSGDAVEVLNHRIYQIFDDPFRAARIAQTEASRAMHAGQVAAAQESGVVVGKRWLASADACPLCLKLDGMEVGLNENFTVDGSGPYAAIAHPPRHPHCMCGLEELIGDAPEPQPIPAQT